MIIDALMVVAKPTPSTSGFDLSPLLPLLGVLIGGLVSAATSFFLNGRSNQQQIKRLEYENFQQQQREHDAYIRSLQDAKRERLRSAYKVILNAADKYKFEIQQHNHMSDPVNISLTGVDEAVTEITLEDVGADVTKIFFELRGAFYTFSAHMSMPSEGTRDEVSKQKELVFEKSEELTTAMQKHLKELEH